MKNSIIIDMRKVNSRDELHECLQEKLQLSAYYGKNLDALFDELTSICKDTHVHVVYSDKHIDTQLNQYQKCMLSVFQAAENENPRLSFAKEKSN